MVDNILKLIRPQQWVKNGVVLAGIIFAGEAGSSDQIMLALQAVVAFCFLSSSIYIINDMVDRNQDRQHPLKKDRPLASGAISLVTAGFIGVVLLAGGIILSADIGQAFLIVAASYVVLNILYSFVLKNIVIIDVMSIAAGFALRATAGAIAVDVEISVWLLQATFVLALFLALGKRRHELESLKDGAETHRKILGQYSTYLLDQLIGIVTASTVITYLFYTLSPEVSAKLGTDYLFVTVPFVIYGIFRYLYLVHQEKKGGFPTKLLISDLPLFITVLLWLATIIIILYII